MIPPGRQPGLPQRFIEKILKIRPAGFEPGGIDIGQIVGDDIDIERL